VILLSSLEIIFSLKGQANNVVVQRSSQAFNKVDPDQAKDENFILSCYLWASIQWIHGTGKKGGGSVGITKTTSALCRWTLPYNII